MKKLFLIFALFVCLFSISACSSKTCDCPNCKNEGEVDLATYSIFYHTNGGNLEGFYPVAYNSLTPTFTLNSASREGYRFLGWSLAEGLSSPMITEVEKGTTGNLNLYATWGELYSIRVNTFSHGFFNIEYIKNEVLSGEVAELKITTAEPVSHLQWEGFAGNPCQLPDSCEYNEKENCFFVKFTLVKNIVVFVQ